MTTARNDRVKELVFEAFELWPERGAAWARLARLVGDSEARRLLEAEGPRRVRLLDLDCWKE